MPVEEFEENVANPMLANGDEKEDWKMRDYHARFLIFNSCDEVRKIALLNSRTRTVENTRDTVFTACC
jgi:hypothetical protein